MVAKQHKPIQPFRRCNTTVQRDVEIFSWSCAFSGCFWGTKTFKQNAILWMKQWNQILIHDDSPSFSVEVSGQPSVKGPQWRDSEPPSRIVLDDESWEPQMDLKETREVSMKDVPTGLSPSAMAAHSPSGRRKSRKITEISREKMSDVNEALLDTQTNEYYTWGESTWDLVIFIGTGALGPAGSFQTCLLAVVNVLMQVVFVAIAYFNFTQPDVDETSVEDARRWRHASGHSLWSYSEVSRESMAERVCKLDKSLEQSGIQAWPNEPTKRGFFFQKGGFFDKSFLPLWWW